MIQDSELHTAKDAIIKYESVLEASKQTGMSVGKIRCRMFKYEAKFGPIVRQKKGQTRHKRREFPVNTKRKKALVQKSIEVKKLYDELGTLAAVGKKLNLSRERIRQILKLYAQVHDDYTPRNDMFIKDIPKEASKNIMQYMKRSGYSSVKMMLRNNKEDIERIIDPSGKKILGKDTTHKTLGISNKFLTAMRIRNKRIQIISRYSYLVSELGYYPNTGHLFRGGTLERRLQIDIPKYWGSFDYFVKRFNLEGKIDYSRQEKYLQKMRKGYIIKKKLQSI